MTATDFLDITTAQVPLVKQLLLNAQSPKHNGFTQIQSKLSARIKPLLEQNDQLISLLGFSSAAGHNNAMGTHNVVVLHQYTFIARPLFLFLKDHLMQRYPEVTEELEPLTKKENTILFDERQGSLIIPISLEEIQDKNVPDAALTPEGLKPIIELTRASGTVWIGEIAGKLPRMEMAAEYFLGSSFTDIDDYMDRGISEQIKQVEDMTHPIIPVAALENNREEAIEFDRTTRKLVLRQSVWFDPYISCGRDNCSLCLEHEIEKNQALITIDKEYREKELAYLREFRDFVEMAFNAFEMTWLLTNPAMDSDDDDEEEDDDI